MGIQFTDDIIDESIHSRLRQMFRYAFWVAALPFSVIYGLFYILNHDWRLVFVLFFTICLTVMIFYAGYMVKRRYDEFILYMVFTSIFSQNLIAVAFIPQFRLETMIASITALFGVYFALPKKAIYPLGIAIIVGYLLAIWLPYFEVWQVIKLSEFQAMIVHTLGLSGLFFALMYLFYGSHSLREDFKTSIVTMHNQISGTIVELHEMTITVEQMVEAIRMSCQKLFSVSQEELDLISKGLFGLDQIKHAIADNDDLIEELDGVAALGAGATGQLSSKLTSFAPTIDDFGQFVQITDDSMREMVAATTEIADSSSNMAGITEDIATAVSGLDDSIKRIDYSALEALDNAKAAYERALEGKNAVDQGTSGMQEVHNSFHEIDTALSSLDEGLEQITTFINVIEEIAAKTNLLSLNASILASQAGSAGAGFSVVAEEIKTLAERTNNSTREVADIIEKVLKQRSSTLRAMSSGVEIVERAVEQTRAIEKSIENVINYAHESEARMADIVDTTKMQRNMSQVISKTSNELTVISRNIRTATNAQEESSANVSMLVSQAVTSVDAIRQSIKNQARNSQEVAVQIDGISSKTGSIRKQSRTQKRFSNEAVDVMRTVNQQAEMALTETKIILDAVTLLNDQMRKLRIKELPV